MTSEAKNAMVSPLTLRLESHTRLSQEERAGIEQISRRGVRLVPARRDLIREGDPPRSVFLIREGWACRYKQLPDGRRQIISFLLPGDVFDLDIFVLKRMDHSIAAITPLEVAEIGREDVERLMTDYPRIIQGLRRDELVDAAVQREWTLNVGQRTAFERIAHLLCELFARLECVGRTESNSCDFPLTQVDLADATGLTAVHVNRTLQELRKARLIELQNKRLTIPDLPALEAAGTFNSQYLHLERRV